MNDLVIYLLAMCSLTLVLAKGDILEPAKMWIVRKAPKRFEHELAIMLTCSMCIGFWVGFCSSLIVGFDGFALMFGDRIGHFLAGTIVGSISSVVDKIAYGRNSSGNTEPTKGI